MPRSNVIVEVCRANSPEDLHTLVGAAKAYWAAQGYAEVVCEYAAPGAGFVSVYRRTTDTGDPEALLEEQVDKHTAVLVITR